MPTQPLRILARRRDRLTPCIGSVETNGYPRRRFPCDAPFLVICVLVGVAPANASDPAVLVDAWSVTPLHYPSAIAVKSNGNVWCPVPGKTPGTDRSSASSIRRVRFSDPSRRGSGRPPCECPRTVASTDVPLHVSEIQGNSLQQCLPRPDRAVPDIKPPPRLSRRPPPPAPEFRPPKPPTPRLIDSRKTAGTTGRD